MLCSVLDTDFKLDLTTLFFIRRKFKSNVACLRYPLEKICLHLQTVRQVLPFGFHCSLERRLILGNSYSNLNKHVYRPFHILLLFSTQQPCTEDHFALIQTALPLHRHMDVL